MLDIPVGFLPVEGLAARNRNCFPTCRAHRIFHANRNCVCPNQHRDILAGPIRCTGADPCVAGIRAPADFRQGNIALSRALHRGSRLSHLCIGTRRRGDGQSRWRARRRSGCCWSR